MTQNTEPDEEPDEESEETSEKSKKYASFSFKVPADRLQKIKEDFGVTDDTTAMIIYQAIEKKRPEFSQAVQVLSKKSKKEKNPSSSSMPPGASGIDKMMETVSDITGELLSASIQDTMEKKRKYEEEIVEKANTPPPPPQDDFVKEYVKSALEVDKTIKQKALNDLLKPRDEEKEIKSVVRTALQEVIPREPIRKEKTFDEKILDEVKETLSTDIIKKLKGEGVKITPELVGQLINGVSSIVERFEPLFSSATIKANTQASQIRLSTIADLQRSLQENFIRSLKDIIYLAKENDKILSNPVVQAFIENMGRTTMLTMKLIESELTGTTPETNEKIKKVNLDEIK